MCIIFFFIPVAFYFVQLNMMVCLFYYILFFFFQLGKSVVAKTKISAGSVITLNMLTIKVAEPHGFPPEEIFDLEGKTVKRDIEEDESVTEEAIENYNTRTKC